MAQSVPELEVKPVVNTVEAEAYRIKISQKKARVAQLLLAKTKLLSNFDTNQQYQRQFMQRIAASRVQL